MTSAARVSCGLYKTLLFTYPREFRQRFKCEMVSTFSDLICGEWEQKGVLGVARVWRSALGEVFFVAVPLHLQSNFGYHLPGAPFVGCLFPRGIFRQCAICRRAIVYC